MCTQSEPKMFDFGVYDDVRSCAMTFKLAAPRFKRNSKKIFKLQQQSKIECFRLRLNYTLDKTLNLLERKTTTANVFDRKIMISFWTV